MAATRRDYCCLIDLVSNSLLAVTLENRLTQSIFHLFLSNAESHCKFPPCVVKRREKFHWFLCGQTDEVKPGTATAVPGSTAGAPESLERPVFLDRNLKPVGPFTETQHNTPTTCTHSSNTHARGRLRPPLAISIHNLDVTRTVFQLIPHRHRDLVPNPAFD